MNRFLCGCNFFDTADSVAGLSLDFKGLNNKCLTVTLKIRYLIWNSFFTQKTRPPNKGAGFLMLQTAGDEA